MLPSSLSELPSAMAKAALVGADVGGGAKMAGKGLPPSIAL